MSRAEGESLARLEDVGITDRRDRQAPTACGRMSLETRRHHPEASVSGASQCRAVTVNVTVF